MRWISLRWGTCRPSTVRVNPRYRTAWRSWQFSPSFFVFTLSPLLSPHFPSSSHSRPRTTAWTNRTDQLTQSTGTIVHISMPRHLLILTPFRKSAFLMNLLTSGSRKSLQNTLKKRKMTDFVGVLNGKLLNSYSLRKCHKRGWTAVGYHARETCSAKRSDRWSIREYPSYLY